MLVAGAVIGGGVKCSGDLFQDGELTSIEDSLGSTPLRSC